MVELIFLLNTFILLLEKNQSKVNKGILKKEQQIIILIPYMRELLIIIKRNTALFFPQLFCIKLNNYSASRIVTLVHSNDSMNNKSERVVFNVRVDSLCLRPNIADTQVESGMTLMSFRRKQRKCPAGERLDSILLKKSCRGTS